MVVEFARGETASRRLTWQKQITRQTVEMCLNCQCVLDNHLGESTNGRVAFANKGELQGLNLQNFKFQDLKSKQPQTLRVCLGCQCIT